MAANSRESSPVPVKRAARTYGRVRETAGADSFESTVSHIPSWRSNLRRDASPALQESAFSEPMPLTTATEHKGDDDESKGDLNASFGFRFAWKDKLKQLDQDSDEDDVQMPPPSKWDASKSASAISENTVSSQDDPSNIAQSISLVETLQPDATASPTPSQSSPPVKIHRRQRKKNLVADSESDSEMRHARQSPFSSPHKQTIKNSSPPTSDDELPAYVTTEPASKDKVKAPSSMRDSVIPPQLDRGLLQDKKPRKSKKASKPKIKAPTKKELAETEKDRFRIAVDQHVSIAKVNNQAKFTLASLFDTIKADVRKGKPVVPASSDPIIAFSSSPSATLRGSIPERRPWPTRSPSIKVTNRDSDDDDLPEIGDLVQDDKSKRDERKKQKDLAELKQRALAFQRARKRDDDSDDDLEIVDTRKPAATKFEEPKVMAKAAEQARRREALYGVPDSSHSRSRAKEQRLTRSDLNAGLTTRIQEINAGVTRSKEEEWVRRGGKLTTDKEASDNAFSTTHAALEAFAEKGLMAVAKKEAEMEAEMEVDTEEDDEWTPEMRGSASPEPGMNVEEAEPDTSLADITLVDERDENDDGDRDENDENVPIRRRPRKSAILLSDSEDENDENKGPRQRPFGSRILVEDDLQDDMGLESARLSSISSEERLMEEGDKENNTQLMYDRSEDKENKAVVQHGYRRPALSRHGSMYALEQGIRSQLSMSPDERNIFDDDITQGALRSPLRTLADEDPSQPPATLEASSMLLPSPSLKYFDDAGVDAWEEGPNAPLLGSLFKAGTQKELHQRPGGLFQKKSFGNALDLSQDVTALQPAFGSENLQRKADAIFEDEQRYLLEAANKSSRRKEELYVDEHGFLTQTRPAGEVQVYRSVPTPSQSFQSPTGLQPSADLISSSQRLPLRTISMTSIVAEPEESPYQPLSRLRRLRNPPEGGYRSSSTPPPVPLPQSKSAFDVLQEAAKKEEKAARKKMINSEFLEEEAQESDEDEHMFGFKKQTDDEEDGDHLDASLATLVDDSKMDDDTMAADRVHEKFQEHLQQDDEELEKLHIAATKGEIRHKKRRKFGLLDSDNEEDEEEDEQNAEIRRRMNKRSRIERSDIKGFEGTPFFDVYATTTRDDNFEFGYLRSDSPSNEEQKKSEDDDAEVEEEQDESAQFISRDELKRQVQEMAQQGDGGISSMDYNDVSWMEEDEPEISVKAVTYTSLPRNRRTNDVDGLEVREPVYARAEQDQQDQSRLQAWAKAETRTRHVGPGRSVSGAAVTGHGKRVKSGGGSLTNRALASTSASNEHKVKPLKAAPSMLAEINRKARAERY